MGQQHSSVTDEENPNKKDDSVRLKPLSSPRDETDTDLSSELLKAAAESNVKVVKSLLEKRADPKQVDKNGRNALHHACRHELDKDTNIEDLLSTLLKSGCSSLINATDKKGNTALWYAIKYRNSRAAVTLIENGADYSSRRQQQGNTAFHEACLAGLLDVVDRMFYYVTPHGNNPVKWKGHLNATPLHAACKNSHLKIVKKLLERGADIKAVDDVGKTALHAAASGVKVDGTIETVDFLLKHGAMKILNKPSTEEERKTPISTACFYGHHETVKFLLDKGAVIDDNCMKFAVEKDFSFTARVLLQSSQWRKCLRQKYNGEPIMNKIIRRMPEVAVDVLDRSTVERLKRHDEEGRVVFNFEFLECFNEKNASFEDETQARTSDYVDDPAGLAKHHAKRDIAQKEKEFEDVVKQRKRSFGPSWGLKSFNKSQHPLYVIAKSRNYRLLTHPVVRALIHYKWMPYGFVYYLVNLVIFALFLIFATSFSLSVATPFSQDCPNQGNGTCNIPESRQNGIKSAAAMTILFATVRLLMRLGKELLLVCRLRKKYFTSVHVLFDWVDVPSYTLTIIFSLVFHYDCPCPQLWQWQVGIIGLFLSWLTLLKFANKFPIISKYVLMFGKIIETFGKVALSIGIPLVLAFAWPFYMALYDPEVSRSSFQDAGIAVAKVLSMTIGEFDYNNIFRRDSSGASDLQDELPYLPATYILWVVYLILMPLLLNNLLVGLAIGDIRSVEEHAELRKLALKIELVLEFEDLLPPVLRSKLRSGYKIVYPWKQKRIEWLREEHESCELVELILERKAQKLTGKHGKLHHDKYYHHTEHPVKHTTAYGRKSKYETVGSTEDLQMRLERLEDLLEKMAVKMDTL